MDIYESGILKEVRRIAKSKKWIEIDHQENISMVSFTNGVDRINVYYTKMTVATCINHPKKGKTQLFRKRVKFDLLTKIFENPRIHTDIGYY